MGCGSGNWASNQVGHLSARCTTLEKEVVELKLRLQQIELKLLEKEKGK
jgi:hypothetical protein